MTWGPAKYPAMPTTLVKVTLVLALCVLALTGCRSGSPPRAQAPDSPDEETDWFCQEEGDTGEWKCIQDDELARDPEQAKRDLRDRSD